MLRHEFKYSYTFMIWQWRIMSNITTSVIMKCTQFCCFFYDNKTRTCICVSKT